MEEGETVVNAREQLSQLYRREDRLYSAKWAQGVSAQRRRGIDLAQRRIWDLKKDVAPRAMAEVQDEIWPNGLPAHP
jgi:hypothetical protein